MKDKAAIATGGGTVGVMLGYLADPQKGPLILNWIATQIGTVGLVLIVCLGFSNGVFLFGNWLMWNRLKEKDIECAASQENSRKLWKAVVDQKEADNRNSAKVVSDLLVQVTKLVERVAPIQTRSN